MQQRRFAAKFRQNVGLILSFVGFVLFAIVSFGMMRASFHPATQPPSPVSNRQVELLSLSALLMVGGLLLRVAQVVLPLLRGAKARSGGARHHNGL